MIEFTDEMIIGDFPKNMTVVEAYPYRSTSCSIYGR